MQESKAKSSQLGDMALESTQSGFIQKLLKECKTKVDFIIRLFDLSFNGVVSRNLSKCDISQRMEERSRSHIC